MQKRRRRNKILAGILAVVMILTASKWVFSSADAAGKIDSEHPCSIQWSVDTQGEFADDLKSVEVLVSLYKVADVSASRHFTDTALFEGLKIEELATDETATAEHWQAKAEEARQMVEKEAVSAVKEGQLVEGQLKMEQLETGIYLVLMKNTQTKDYEYSFEPYLISLPDNEYFSMEGNGTDAWIYDLSASIKAERKPLYGKLEIQKTLDTYQKLLGETIFVFQVEGEKDGQVYSNVVSITFNGPGTKQVILDRLPAGMDVTVTEVYSGTSYQPTSETVKRVRILADGADGSPVSAAFSNTYNEKLVPGFGIQNHFEYDENEGWRWSQQN